MPVPSAFQFHPAGLEGAHAGCLSDGVLAHFARTDADRLLDLVDEDLAVADLAGVGGLANGLDGLLLPDDALVEFVLHVEQFLARVQAHDAAPLSMLTGGIHLHTLRCPDAAACERACAALKAAGLLLDD